MTTEKNSFVITALRIGVGVSFVLITLGLLLSIGHDARTAIRPGSLLSFSSHFLHAPGVALIHLGLIALLATPFARVIALIATFVRERDRTFVAVSFGVLLLLIITIVIGMSLEGR